jgi:hypothetical protein
VASNNASNRKLTCGESKTGYGKAGKQSALSNFPTATTTTNYNQLWDTDSEGKVNLLPFIAHIVEHCCVGITVVHQQPLKFHRGNIANCTALIMLCGFQECLLDVRLSGPTLFGSRASFWVD